MEQFAKETLPVSLEEEMRRSYLDYAMSVIVGRALPDVRDGLKPVHRRVLFAMHESNNVWNRPYVKCARIVGEVLGKYHPHGDSATYEALVRMAQDFSMRYTLIDGQGNFGSIDGDSAAAYRYTECRLERISSELLADIDKETVDFVPNYDGKEMEPTALPTRIPNLLINGSSGIAVGMATNIPPHNLVEVVNAGLALLANPDISIDELIEIIPAPDFPTAGIIHGLAGVHQGYRTGRGRVIMRARTHFEDMEKGNRQSIIVDELPYQVNKKSLLERIAELVNEKKLEGISEIRDESDKSGMRMVFELKRGELPEVVLNNLYKQTQLQDSFGINMVALVDGQPRLLEPEADARCLPRAPARGGDAAHRVRIAQGARARPYPRRPGGGAFERRRDHRPDQAVADAARSQTGADGQGLAFAAGGGDARARRGRCFAPRRPGRKFRPGRWRLPFVRRPGAGDPGDAPAAPHRPGAGQDRVRIQGGDAADRRLSRHPRQACAHHGDHRR